MEIFLCQLLIYYNRRERMINNELDFEIIKQFSEIFFRFSVEIDDFQFQDDKLGKDIFIMHTILRTPHCVMSDIVSHLRIPNSSVTRKVKYLIEQGYIKRRIGKKDRRQINLRLTQKGREAVFQMFTSFQHQFHHIFINFDKNSKALFLRMLNTIKFN